MNDAPLNPITRLRGERTQEQLAFEVNQLLGLPLLTGYKISLLERASYAAQHKIGADALAVFALYAVISASLQGKPLDNPEKYLATLYAEYLTWVQVVATK